MAAGKHGLPPDWRAPFEESFGRSFRSVAIATGTAIDQVLGALRTPALAFDAGTIWLSSLVGSLGARQFLLILGHELAHTVQLQRAGADETESLELEAWQAAAAALEGKSFCIIGRGHGCLAAAGLYMNTSAKEYFETFGIAPLIVPAGKTAKIDPLVFESILDLMAVKFSSEDDFVIEVHGHPNGMGIPIAKGEKASATTQVLATLPRIVSLRADLTAAGNDLAKLQQLVKTKTQDGNAVSPGDPNNPASVASAVQQNRKKIEDELDRLKKFAGVTDEAVMARLVTKMQSLKTKSRNRIELRSCNMGHFQGVMDFFRDLFNAAVLRAPTNFSAFGHFIPASPRSDATFNNFVKQNAKCFSFMLSGSEKFAFDYQPLPHAQANTPSAANSDAATKDWIKKFLGNAPKVSAAKFPVHFLLTNPPAFPKETNYASHLKESKKATKP
jgi:Domain of unknown function (DUF4157)